MDTSESLETAKPEAKTRRRPGKDLETLGKIERLLDELDDDDQCERILKWLVAKYAVGPRSVSPAESHQE